MSCCVYGQLLPDNLDLNNRSGKRPGYQVFMTVSEAEDLISGLKTAISKIKPKKRKPQKKALPESK